MKRTFYVLLLAVILLIIVLFKINSSIRNDEEKNYKYNFSVIMNDIENSFSYDLLTGMEVAAKDLNVSLNFSIPDKSKSSYGISDFLDMSILSKSDGLILAPNNNMETMELMDRAFDENMPILTLIKDIEKPQKFGYNGLNSFDVGIEFNKLLNENKKNLPELNVAFIFQDEENSIVDKEKFIKGLNYKDKAIKTSYLVFEEVEFGALSAEDITFRILKRYPEVNTFICLSPNIASGTIRALIDTNRIHEISVLNFGYSPEIKRYLNKKLIDYTVTADFWRLGKNAVENLYYLKQHENYRSIGHLKLETLE